MPSDVKGVIIAAIGVFIVLNMIMWTAIGLINRRNRKKRRTSAFRFQQRATEFCSYSPADRMSSSRLSTSTRISLRPTRSCYRLNRITASALSEARSSFIQRIRSKGAQLCALELVDKPAFICAFSGERNSPLHKTMVYSRIVGAVLAAH